MRILRAAQLALLLAFTQLAGAATLDAKHRQGLIQECVNAYQAMPEPPLGSAQSIPALQYRSDPDKLRKFCSCHAAAADRLCDKI